MKFLTTLASYVPGIILDQLVDDEAQELPFRKAYKTVVVFCDISGFTKLSEFMARTGKGAEGVSRNLNKYFQMMVKIISSGGGDVLKFAGDAMIVLWPEDEADSIETRLQRATQCAVFIQQQLDQAILEDSVSLSVKIGIGVGMVSVIHIGGTHKRMEYLAVGDPLIQAFHAEHHAVPGQVMVSPQVWQLLKNLPGGFTAAHKFEDGYVSIDVHAPFEPIRQRRLKPFLNDDVDDHFPILEQRIKGYVPNSVLPMLLRESYEDDMKWANETRRCAVMFVNLGLEEHNMLAAGDVRQRDAMLQVHNVLVGVQKAVYHYEGSVNKFLMDDKGSTLIACFGLSPVSHSDDALRAVLSALYICERLFDLSFPASVGITVGDVFCGVVGSTTRREYTVLGDSVNLAARLMQKACEMTDSGRPTGGIIVDEVCRDECAGLLEFQRLEPIEVKGKTGLIKIFHPFPEEFSPSQLKAPMHQADELPRNIFREMHLQQLRNVEVHKALHFHMGVKSWNVRHQVASSLMREPRNLDDSLLLQPRALNGEDRNMSGDNSTVAPGLSKKASFMNRMGRRISGMSGSMMDRSGGGSGGGGGASGAVSNPLGGMPRKTGRTSSFGMQPISPQTRNSKQGGGAVTQSLFIPASRLQHATEGTPLFKKEGRRDSTMSGKVGSVAIAVPSAISENEDEAAECPTLKPIPFSTATNFASLLMTAYDRADAENLLINDRTKQQNLLRGSVSSAQLKTQMSVSIQEDEEEEEGGGNGGDHVGEREEEVELFGPDNYRLHIVGTRCFLPRHPISIRWLTAFMSDAHGLACDAVELGDLVDPNDGGGGFNPKLQLVHESNALNVQSRSGVARQLLMEKHAILIDEAVGSVIMLEGDPGSGKTSIVANFVARADFVPDDQGLAPPIFTTSAVPFHPRPYGVWCTILQQYLDYLGATISSSTSAVPSTINAANGLKTSGSSQSLLSPLGSQRAAARMDSEKIEAEMVKQVRTTLCLSLLPAEFRTRAHLLNELVGVDCEAVLTRNAQTSNADPEKEILKILIALLKALTEACPAVIVIDEGHAMDAQSWALAHAVAHGCENPDGFPSDDVSGSIDETSSPSPSSTLNGSIQEEEESEDSKQNASVSSRMINGTCMRVMLVIMMRPVQAYGPTFKRIAPDYVALDLKSCSDAHVTKLKLEGLPPEEMSVLVCSKLGPQVVVIGDRLQSAVEELCCGGNPMFVEEFCQQIRRSDPPVLVYTPVSKEDNTVDVNSEEIVEVQYYHVDLIEGVNIIDPRISMPRNRVAKLLTEKLDKCSHKQKLLLNTASSVVTYFHRRFQETQKNKSENKEGVFNTIFKLSYLAACHPVAAHKATVEDDVASLIAKGLLSEVSVDTLKGPAAALVKGNSADRLLKFTHGIILVHQLQRMMLKGQAAELINRVGKHQNDLDEEQRMAFMFRAQKALGSIARVELKKGPLRIRKMDDNLQPNKSFGFTKTKRYIEGGDWKERHCVLKGSKLFMYRKADDNTHTQYIDLKGGQSELELFEVYGRYAFRVESKLFHKDGKDVEDLRPFIFASALDPNSNPPESIKRDVDDWHYMFKYAIENSDMQAKQPRGSLSATMATTQKKGKTTSSSLKALRDKRAHELRRKKNPSVDDSFSSMSGSGDITKSPSTSADENSDSLNGLLTMPGTPGAGSFDENGNLIDTSLKLINGEMKSADWYSTLPSGRMDANVGREALISILTESNRSAAVSALASDLEILTEEDDNAVDSRLLLRIHGCTGLINTNTHGVSNPYCKIIFDAVSIETKSCGDTTVSPELKRDLALPASITQWDRSSIRIEVWSREPFVTDDFLGQVVLPLKDMVPTDWDEDAVIDPSQILTLPLLPRFEEEVVRGSLQMGYRLIMSPRTTSKASSLGGVEALQRTVKSNMITQAAMEAARMGKTKAKTRKAKAPRPSALALNRTSGRPTGNEVESASDAKLRSRLISESEPGQSTSVGILNGQASLRGTVSEEAVTGLLEGLGPAAATISEAHQLLANALLLVECQALQTLPSIGTKGVDRQWIHGELSDALGLINQVAKAAANRNGIEGDVSFEDGGLSVSGGGGKSNTRHRSMTVEQSGGGILANSVEEIVQNTDLDAEQQQWLSSQYSRTEGDAVKGSGAPKKQRDSMLHKLRESNHSVGFGGAATSAIGLGRLLRGKSTSSALNAEDHVFWWLPPVSDYDEDDNETVAIGLSIGAGSNEEDRSSSAAVSSSRPKRTVLGPFNAHQMSAALKAGYVSSDTLVHQSRVVDAPAPDCYDEKLWVELSKFMSAIKQSVVFASNDEVDWADTPLPDLLGDYKDWNFNLWEEPASSLDRITLEMFNDLGLMDEFQLESSTLKRFLHRVDMAMSIHNNSYHNRFHSFDVAQTCFVIATQMKLQDFVGSLEVLALIVAALCHDLEHPGTNNAYAVNAMTDLAIRYNDQSPLENHHIAVAWTILRSSGCELFDPLEYDQIKTIRKLMIASILATDMTLHFSLKNELDGVVLRNTMSQQGEVKEENSPTSAPKALESDLDRTILLKVVLHVADISNPCKTWDVGKIWSDRVIEEFFNQGDLEKRLGLPATPNMDRETTKQAELSVNFVDFIVGPFFMALTSLLPKVHICCELMRDNRAEWCRRIETDIQGRKNLKEEQKIEEITKWKRREIAFNEVVTPLIDQAKGKMNGGRRRSTLMVLSEMAAKAKEGKEGKNALDNNSDDE